MNLVELNRPGLAGRRSATSKCAKEKAAISTVHEREALSPKMD